MKKIISVLIAVLILMTVTTVFSAATEENTAKYSYLVDNTEYTVEFSNSAASDEKQEAVAKKLIGLNDSSTQTYGLGCILFGHDYVYDTVYVITHKAKTYSPRCKEDTYDVTYCEDCDYTEQELIGTNYIACCPED